MSVYAVNYDLNRPSQNYTGLIKELESQPAWLHYLKSGWLIMSSLSANQLMERFKPYIDSSDLILVIEVTKNHQGSLTKDQWAWINRHV
jgi:hypothetical protein